MELSNFRLDDKFALITGCAGLLGKQHAKALLDIGASIVITDVNKGALSNTSKSLASLYGNERIIELQMDVSSEESVMSTNKYLKEKGVRISVLVNNAAIDPKVNGTHSGLELTRLENLSTSDWDKQISVGLTGAFICSKVFGTEMAESGMGGCILNIASDLSVIAPDQRLYLQADRSPAEQPVKPITYSVIKTGLIGLTRYLATYWADRGVRCNALSPGGVFNQQSDEFVFNVCERIPMRRMANVDEYHGAIQFLCSDASSYLNGQNIVVDGGRSIW